MGALISDMAKAGVLLATEGCLPSAQGVRVRIDAGDFSVNDGPFAETREIVGGLCMLQVKSKAEAVEWCKRFLTIVGTGQSDIYQLHGQGTAA